MHQKSTYYVPGMLPNSGHTDMNMVDKFSAVTLLSGDKDLKRSCKQQASQDSDECYKDKHGRWGVRGRLRTGWLHLMLLTAGNRPSEGTHLNREKNADIWGDMGAGGRASAERQAGAGTGCTRSCGEVRVAGRSERGRGKED